jgi:GNAT superfamily N-acetyltransferase
MVIPYSLLRRLTLNDLEQIYNLYQIVAQVNQGNLTQEPDEITLNYVEDMLICGLVRGLILGIETEGKIVAYLKAFTSEFRCLAHVLTNATMMVHPDWQQHGYGKQLMIAYLQTIQSQMQHILLFELLPHQSNLKAIQFYKKLGFVQQSVAPERIRTISGNFESEVRLVWYNPNFSQTGLKQYHQFLDNLIHGGNRRFVLSSAAL